VPYPDRQARPGLFDTGAADGQARRQGARSPGRQGAGAATPQGTAVGAEKLVKEARDERADGPRELRKELGELDTAIERLHEAGEKGLLPMDDTLAGRTAKLKARRETLLRDIDGAGKTTQTPLDLLSPATMEAFSQVMRRRQARNVWPCRRPGSPHACCGGASSACTGKWWTTCPEILS
jgi:hypothetical protein